LGSKQAKHFYEFGDSFKLYPEERLLLRHGQPVPLRSLIFDLVVKLVENSGTILSREELIRDVWRETYVEDANLSVSISTLRKALGHTSNGRGEHYIETIPKRGYRFIQAVKEGVDRSLVGPARSIAVLPFQVIKAAKRDGYLGLGLTDTLITKLSQLSQITVLQTSAVHRYTGAEQDDDPVAAGRKLGVDTVLAGTVRRIGSDIRVTARLVDVNSRALLWMKTFDHLLKGVFLLEDLISDEVTQELKLKLSEAQRDQLAKHYTESTEAYHLYLKGRYHWNKRNTENLQKSVEYFKRAIKEDPEYALAYAGLADAYILLNSLPPKQIMPEAKMAAETALEIDGQLAEAHCALAFVKENFDWDWEGAEQSYSKALELNPSYATAHQWYAEHLAITGRHAEAIKEIKRAQALDPLSLSISNSVARQYYFARQYKEAIEQCEHTLEMDPEFLPALYRLGGIYLQSGRFAEAIKNYQKAVTISKNKPVMIAELGYAYAVSGQIDEAEKIIRRLKRLAKKQYLEQGYLGQIFMGLGDKERAFEWLRTAYEERSPLMIYLNVEPIFDPLRADARFEKLLRQLKLTRQSQSATRA
jgi:TolB-like protein/Tfp pilus assembly protein PilF